MKRHILRAALAIALGLAGDMARAQAQPHFDINRYQVEGNTLLNSNEIATLLAPMTGADRDFSDVQKALEALQAAYRSHGYGTVQVHVPEQELSGGVVRLTVVEGRLARVIISGNQHFSDDNIRASLPALVVGQPPDLRRISEAVQLSNDSPAKQVNVSLVNSDAEDNVGDGKVDAQVKVEDNDPLRLMLTADNTGTAATGKWRTGVALQHANLFGRDQVGTLAYTTSPDSPSGVHVDVYSLGYRIPLYSLGDSIDMMYGKSSVNSPSSSPTLGSVLGFTGRGEIYGLRWNHFFPRQGETTNKLVLGLDVKKIDSRCDVSGVELSIAPPTPPVASCVPYKLMPISAVYSSNQRGVKQSLDYNIGLWRNIGVGTSYTDTTTDGRTDRYSYLTPGSRNTVDDFMVLRGGATWLRALSSDWQLRLAGNLQYAPNPLVSAEQLGLVGASGVRGFTERAVAADSGAILNTELYTPPLPVPGNLRLLAFYDIGRGYNSHVGGTSLLPSMTVSSIGVGARYGWGRTVSLKLDVARVGASGNSATESRGDFNAHVSLVVGF